MEKIVYSFDGSRGRHIDIYEDKAVITTKVTLGSLFAGGYSNGEKTIYYRDVIGVQFKKPGLQLGYLQLETSSYHSINPNDNFFGENSFPFESSILSKMEEAVNFIRGKVDEARNNSQTVVKSTLSPADELKKFKELLDSGIISQEEFDQKKKQLLGI